MNEWTFSILYVFAVFISSISQVMLKKSANKTYDSKIKEYLNPYVIISYTMFFSATLCTVLALRYIPLSFGTIFESLGYVFVSILSVIVLKERAGKRKILGMSLIILGILIYSL